MCLVLKKYRSVTSCNLVKRRRTRKKKATPRAATLEAGHVARTTGTPTRCSRWHCESFLAATWQSSPCLVTEVDFAPFNGDEESVRQTTTCGNLPVNRSLTDPTAPFDWIFGTAPTPRFQNALAGDWPAFPNTESTAWMVSQLQSDCGSPFRVRYQGPLGHSMLASCSSRSNSTSQAVPVLPSWTSEQGQSRLRYEGAVPDCCWWTRRPAHCRRC
mmetsp:Transcript_25135/g.63214  ORF Transcript_25135/g.63214 Transcript_25135/m.63214 type:complete len:215 (+) Transcript_25135:702-1346(+)